MQKSFSLITRAVFPSAFGIFREAKVPKGNFPGNKFTFLLKIPTSMEATKNIVTPDFKEQKSLSCDDNNEKRKL